MKDENLVIGAGFAGATLARILADSGEKVLVVDKRCHIGGISYDYKDENGITVHKYGSHIFHTQSPKVWNFLRRFGDFNTYMHRVHAIIDGIETHIPFNLDTIGDIFPNSLANRIQEKLISNYAYNSKIPIMEFLRQNDRDLRFLADFIYEKVFFGYSMKQWGKSPEQLDLSVSSRIPVVVGRDPRYFTDKYQGIPMSGYARLIENMLDSPNIKLLINTDALAVVSPSSCENFKRVLCTGPIDEFFGYKYGPLPYRSLRFDTQSLDVEYYQKNSVVNYPCNYDFTRIHEFKYYLDEKSPKTVICREYPEKFEMGKNERLYPEISPDTLSLYNKYARLASETSKNLFFLGRLGNYKYLDMDKSVEQTMEFLEKIV